MGIIWIKAGKGIRYFEHPSRKHGKRFDRYYALTYKLDGKTRCEGFGWESENYVPGESLQARAERLLAQLRENQRLGNGPRTLADMRIEAKDRRDEELRRSEAEARRLISLDSFFEGTFMAHASRSKKAKSAEKEFSLYRYWIKPNLGELPIIQIDMQAWNRLLRPLDKAKLAIATKRYICGTLCRILRLARELGHQVHVPGMKQLGIGKADENRRQRTITDEEMLKILDALKERDIHAYRIVLFGALTGCRFSEAASLKWGDISSERGITFRDTKNKSSRTIPVSGELEKLFLSMDKEKNVDIVFKNSHGVRYKESPQAFKNVIRELGLNEGHDRLNRISYHSLRHTVATKLAKNLDIRTLMDTMGWKQVSMAARYMHGDEDKKKAALDTVGNFLSPKENATIYHFSEFRNVDSK